MKYASRPYSQLPDGRIVHEFTMENESGARLSLIEYGARITTCVVPNASGEMTDVVLGFDTLDEYLSPGNSHGAVCGRVANRIHGSRFTLNGKTYPLSNNCGEFTAHGGKRGFQASLWSGCFEADGVTMTLTSGDGDQGFPATLVTKLHYRFTEDNALKLHYRAEADGDTPVNLTNHVFFNLAGAGDICNHVLWMNAPYYTPTDARGNVNGEIHSVKDTPFDFSSAKAVGADFSSDALKNAGGYDHNFVFAHAEQDQPEHEASLVCEENGIVMEMYTTEPGLQIYTANRMTPTHGKNGATYGDHCGISLQAQHFPDALQYSHFPSILLHKGDVYHQITEYRFLTKR